MTKLVTMNGAVMTESQKQIVILLDREAQYKSRIRDLEARIDKMQREGKILSEALEGDIRSLQAQLSKLRKPNEDTLQNQKYI